MDGTEQIANEALDRLRQKLLDLSRRNRLLNYRETKKSIRVIDELPDEVYKKIVSDGAEMIFLPTPEQEEEVEHETSNEDAQTPSLWNEKLTELATKISVDQRDYIQLRVKTLLENLGFEGVKNAYSEDSTISKFALAYANHLLSEAKLEREQEKVKNKDVNINTNHELPSSEGQIKDKWVDNYLQTPFPDEVLERRCKNIAQEARTAIEETGSNLLFLSIGFLEWFDSGASNQKLRAPLVLIPVKIEKKKINKETNCYQYGLSFNEEEIITNLSLAQKLDKEFGLLLPEFNYEESTPEAYFNEVKNLIQNKKNWKVAREIVLGFFSFSKILIYKDLDPSVWDKLEKPIIKNPIASQILAGINENTDQADYLPYGEEYNIDELGSDAVPLILDADSSQHSAIVDVINHEKSMVIEGPPGTGKSQSISNIIAAGLNEGKSILFLSEKKAALDVVKSRLDNVGLGDFCLELHSHKTKKANAYADLQARMRRTFRDHETLDQELQNLESEKQKLSDYVETVNSVFECSEEKIYNIFYKANRWRNECQQSIYRFPVDNVTKINKRDVHDRISLLDDLEKLSEDLPLDALTLLDNLNLDYSKILAGDEVEIHEILSALQTSLTTTEKEIKEFSKDTDFPIEFNWNEIENLLSINLEALLNVPADYDNDIGNNFKNHTVEIDDFNSLQKDYLKLQNDLSGSIDLNNLQKLDLIPLKSICEKASALGYEDLKLSKCHLQLENLKSISASIDKLRSYKPQVYPRFFPSIKNIIHLIKVNRHLQVAPPSVQHNGHPYHATHYAKDLCGDLKKKCLDLKRIRTELTSAFNLNLVPNAMEVKNLARDLKVGMAKFLPVLSAEFRKAKSQVKVISNEKPNFKNHEIVDRLIKLSDYLDSVSELSEHSEGKKALGEKFNGIKTNWDELEESIQWANELRELLNNENDAIKTIDEFRSIKTDLQDEIDPVTAEIRNLESLRTSLPVCPLNFGQELEKLKDEVKEHISFIENECAQVVKKINNLEISVLEFEERLEVVENYFSIKESLESDVYKKLLGDLYNGVNTDVSKIISVNDWYLNSQISAFRSDQEDWMFKGDLDHKINLFQKIFRILQKLNDDIIEANENLNKFQIDPEENLNEHSFKNFLKQSNELSNAVEPFLSQLIYLQSLADYSRLKNQCFDLFGAFQAQKLIELSEDPSVNVSVKSIFHANYYESLSKEALSLHSQLANFSRVTHENRIQKFNDLDSKILDLNKKRFAFNASRHVPPRGNNQGRKRDFTELSLIKNEVDKTRAHVPIRQLVRRAGKALQALKPCFMMSPLTVAQYLPPGYLHFDIIVMDEASQLRPEDSLGGVLRGNQIVIVGDPKQLPPTSFFEKLGGEAEDDEAYAIEDAESILDICMTYFPQRRLRWHYRSEHEKLIAFSNSQFYDGDLLVFPSPYYDNRNYGVFGHYIQDAKYRKGRNQKEAEAIVESIVGHFENCPQLSLGIATFNQEQRDLIRDLLEKKQKKNSSLERALQQSEVTSEPFFIKNLENVQGDERDVIFISTTYGPDADSGKVFQRFGPINTETGWRRLNVILTRAKKRLELFTSLTSSNVKITESSSRGAASLKAYLEYVETGKLIDKGESTDREPDSDFEIDVARMLKVHGFKSVPQIGVAGFFIDIGIVHPHRDGEFLLGVECDGASYHSSKSARDRDRLRQEVLESKGWVIHRVWSTDWFKNREKEAERLIDVIKGLLANEERTETQADQTSKSDYTEEKVLGELFKFALDKSDQIDEEFEEHDAETSTNDELLKKELLNYRLSNIDTTFEDDDKGLLRDEILIHLISKKPTEKEEFYSSVPMELRQSTDPAQLKTHLEDVLEIIDDYSH